VANAIANKVLVSFIKCESDFYPSGIVSENGRRVKKNGAVSFLNNDHLTI
jgi:hypothetical protein